MTDAPTIDTPEQYEAYRRRVVDFLWNEVEPLTRR